MTRKLAPVARRAVESATWPGHAGRLQFDALLAVARAAERRQWSGEDIQGRVSCVFCNGARMDDHFPNCVLLRLRRVSAPAPSNEKRSATRRRA